MRFHQLTIAAVICLLLSGCGLMRGGAKCTTTSSACSQCNRVQCDGSCFHTALPLPNSSCDCLVCQMIWQSQRENANPHDAEPAPPDMIPEFEAPLIDGNWNEPLPLGVSANEAIDAIVNEAEDCDCEACATFSESRRQSIAHVDAEHQFVDLDLDTQPPSAELPPTLTPMFAPAEECKLDSSQSLPLPLPRSLPESLPQPISQPLPALPDPATDYDSEYGAPLPLDREGCVLEFSQVACAAARHSALANLLAKENQIIGSQQNRAQQTQGFSRLRQNRTRDCEDPCATALRRKLMCYQALEQRNDASAKSLALYLVIAEAEAQTPLIERALADLRKNQQRIDALRSEDLDIPFDETEVNRKRNTLESEKERLELARNKATEQLKVLIGSDLCPQGRITTMVMLDVNSAQLDHETEVAEGMQWRADVATCEHLRCCLSEETLDAVRSALSLSSSLIGTSACPPSLRDLCRLFACDNESDACEIQQRRQQLNELCIETRRQAQSEIRQAALEVDANARLITIAESTVASWEKRVQNLRLLREADKATAFEVTAAELELIRSRSDLITRQLDYKRAHVNLAEAKGQLPIECGYRVPDPNQCCR